MKFKQFLNEGKVQPKKVQPKSKEELIQIILDTIDQQGYECDLNFIDTSKITDMNGVFIPHFPNQRIGRFDGDISDWDVSNVTDMQYMFADSSFTGKNTDFSKWNTSKVTSFQGMFMDSKFNVSLNLGIRKWNTKNVKKRDNWLGGFFSMFKNPGVRTDDVKKIASGWGLDFKNENDADVIRNMW